MIIWNNKFGLFLVVMIWNKVQDNWTIFVIMICDMEEVVDDLVCLGIEKTLLNLIELLIKVHIWWKCVELL
jgi:hypothetical protein